MRDWHVGRILTLIVAGVVTFAILGSGAAASSYLEWTMLALAFGLLEGVRLRLPQGGRMSITAAVSVVAIWALPPTSAAVAQFVGLLLSAAADESAPSLLSLLALTVQKTTSLLIAYAVYALVGIELVHLGTTGMAALPLALAGLMYTFVDVLLFLALTGKASDASYPSAMIRLLALVGPAYMSQVSVGVVFVLVVAGLGLLAAPILLLLVLLLQSSFSLLLRVRTAYAGTVGALARLAEQQSPEGTGHGERVGAMAVAVGRELGLPRDALEALSFASTLHDIGYLKTGEVATHTPYNPGIGTAAAEAGAAIIDCVEFLAPASQILRHVGRPLTRAGADGNSVEYSAAILEVCCIYDHVMLVEGSDHKSAMGRLQHVSAISSFPEIGDVLEGLVLPVSGVAD